jgi:hypothetical protein
MLRLAIQMIQSFLDKLLMYAFEKSRYFLEVENKE